jgi:DNA-binding response OmpR family regulator
LRVQGFFYRRRSENVQRILYIEDEPEIGEWVKQDLEGRGYRVTWLKSGEGALEMASEADIAILDVMLPGLDGFTVGQRLKQQRSDLPILMLTARTALEDKLAGLQFADDYLTKPFHPEELAARVEVLLRRFGVLSAQPVMLGKLWISLEENRVIDTETGREVSLTQKEHGLLAYFLRHPNQIVTKEQLYEAVWGEEFIGGDNTLMVHIRHLREKIERDPSKPEYLQTIRGLGYRLKR